MSVNIGFEIKKIAKDREIGATKLAELSGQSRGNVNNIFTRKTIDTGLLFTVSEILRFDFFSLYSKKLKIDNHELLLTGMSEVEILKEKLELQTQNAISQQRYIHLLEEKLESMGYKFPETKF